MLINHIQFFYMCQEKSTQLFAGVRNISYICTNKVHPKQTIMIIISSKEFRDNQKAYFDRVDGGEQVIVQRGKDKSYMLQPIHEDDYFFTPEMLGRIDESMQQIREGKGIELSNVQELKEFLKNL
ncbi:hypothetical protein M2480_001955 [Parabacteroides sp. PFB2-12]|nr:hypothetical protein [Parabacteroides sp. PM6-13]MDH6390966.1 hypothetical protein [Parabacteroides sp. PFB2-12]